MTVDVIWPLPARLANRELGRRVRRRTGVRLGDLGPMRAAGREALLGLNLTDRRFGYPLHSGVPESGTTLVVIAKQPRPGRVKTRLTPPCTPGQAAVLAEAALTDTLHAVLAAPARRRVLVLDGEPGPWLPPGFDIVPQCGGGLDERLAGAFAAADGPALLIGMDTPQVTPGLLAVDWAVADAWFGPAADGGFWALGLRVPDPGLVRGVPMSTASTGACQRARLHAAGLRVADLPRLRDVDTAEDAVAVAREVPRSRFAAQVRELAPVLGPVAAARLVVGDVREQA